jgi:hypothetical protein
MKNRGLLIVLMFLPLMGFVQTAGPTDEFSVKWGTPHEFSKKYNDLGYVGNMKDGILQISLNRKADVLIQRFSTDKLSPTNLLSLDIGHMPDHFVPDLFTWFGNYFYMFYSTWDKEAQEEHLFADKINLESGTFADDPQELIVADKIAGATIATGFYKFSTANKYQFNFSIDSSKLLVSYRKQTDIKDDSKSHDKLGFFVFDRDLKLIWGNEFRMPYTEKMMDNNDFAVDSKGTAYLLSKVYKGSRVEKAGDEPNYHYEVMKFGQGYEEPKQIKIKLDDKFINDLYLTENFAGEMVCAGFYRTVFKSSNISALRQLNSDGAFIVKIDHNDSLYNVQKGYYEFPTEILREFEKTSAQNKIDRQEKKDEAEAPGVYLRKVFLADDGSYIFVGEQYLVIMKTVTTGNSVNTYYKYLYGDIYVMKIGADGEMAWARKIPKNQEGKLGQGGMSFKYYWHDGESYFFYLDNLKNLNLAPDKAPYKHMDGAGGYLTVCKLDKDGNMTKGKLFNVRDDDLTICPANLDWISPTVLIGRAANNNQSKLMKIEHLN